MVTTITESGFKKLFHWLSAKNINILKIKATNGTKVDYTGYIEMDVEFMGTTIPN